MADLPSQTDSLGTKLWKLGESPIAWGGVGVLFGAIASLISLKYLFVATGIVLGVALIRINFFERLWVLWRVAGNVVLCCIVAVGLMGLWRVIPKPKEPPTLDQIVDAFSQKFPWLANARNDGSLRPPGATGNAAPSSKPAPTTVSENIDLNKLIFKDSPLFTSHRQRVITKYFLNSRAYLVGVGVDVPKEFPPIGVETDKTMAPHVSSSSGPSYHDTIWMKADQLDNPRMIIQSYFGYVFYTILMKPMIQKFQAQPAGQSLNAETQKEDEYRWFAELVIFQYFTWSFWDKRDKEETVCPYHQSPMPVSYLWGIRDRYGKRFTDRLVAYTTKEISDNPSIGPTERFPDWFVRSMTNANSVVDNKAEKMFAIREMLNQCGWLSAEK